MSKTSVYMGTTQVDPTRTVGEISSLLVRMRAVSIATDYAPGGTGKIAAVRFSINIPGIAQPVFFRLPCRTEKLAKLLRDPAQAERTGWRQVLRWVESQLAMIDAGMTRTEEVFMPYAVIPGSDQTMFNAWESQQRLLEAPRPQ